VACTHHCPWLDKRKTLTKLVACRQTTNGKKTQQRQTLGPEGVRRNKFDQLDHPTPTLRKDVLRTFTYGNLRDLGIGTQFWKDREPSWILIEEKELVLIGGELQEERL